MAIIVRHFLGLSIFLVVLGGALSPDRAIAHNVGAGLFGYTLSVTVDPEKVKIDYMIEIPTSVLLKEFWEFLEQNQDASVTDKDRHITSIMTGRLARGLMLICNNKALDLQEVDALQEKTGFGNYNFFQYRIRLNASLPKDHNSMTLTLINKNYTGFRGVYFTSVSVTSEYKVVECSLRHPEQRFLMDTQTGVPWSLWEGQRNLEVHLRAPRIWEGSGRPSEYFVLDNRTLYNAQLSPGSPRPPGSLSGRGDSTTSRIGKVLHEKELNLTLVVFALGMALMLGAVHALSPGHGKSLVAAYLVGTRGRVWDAVLLGGIVTFTHVFSVILLGLFTLLASHYFVPEQMLPYLEVGSGVLILVLGIYLVWSRWPKAHVHIERSTGSPHGHPHIHGEHGVRSHPAGFDHSEKKDPLRTRELLILGLSGGIVPCPSALVILLMALAINRILLGLGLIVAFSLGLATVLIAMGLAAVWAGSSFSKVREDAWLLTWLPVVSGFVIVVVGITMVLRSLWVGGIMGLYQ